ncbi:Ubiquitin-conjugating enzyme E2 7 [Hibiscus syriacus]|uniref:Ubiquitin-conjugating enzyme E2 7 n=1 Tax=Hibiscus syriacus TaxID=106335 RepID=A0A6A3C4K1_HIBSY|nr:Ubiquitin-conjugating enzyme E2 7 [Hibiscus syriacus]
MASQASLLLQKQLKNPVDGFSAGLVDENNIFEWSVTIIGPPDTLYEGGFFNAIMSFPPNYPNSPPTVKFTTEIWHPNVYPDGRVCISILHPPGDDPNGYGLQVSAGCRSIHPNDESPANVEAAGVHPTKDSSVMKRPLKCLFYQARHISILTLYGDIRPHLRRNPSPSPTKSVYLHILEPPSQSFTIRNGKSIKSTIEELFSAQLTLRNKISLVTTIASKLSPVQRTLFEDTCFGPWLKVRHPGGDAMLTHLWLQTMTSDLPESIKRGNEEIWFHFPPVYTCFGREEFCLITGLRFGHDDVGRYTSHITRPSWLSRVFPELSMEKMNLHVDDLTRLLNKKDGFTLMDDVDVVRVCLLVLLHVGFLGREARQPISKDLILLVEDLNAWNLFPWGSYLWKATWNKLSSAFDDRKSLRGDGSKYTLSGFIWAFKIWIFEAFPDMQTYALKTLNDISRAIFWKRKRRLLIWEELLRYTTINDEANTPLQRLTPTEAELATDWWQASKRFFDGMDDE